MRLSAFEEGKMEILPELTVKNVSKSENKNYIVEDLTLTSTVQSDNVCRIIEFFESETITLAFCYCDSFDDEGSPLHYRLQHKPEPIWLREFPNPYISLSATFVNRYTMQYAFDLIMHTNSDVIRYIVDKSKQSKCFNIEPSVVNRIANIEPSVNVVASAPAAPSARLSVAEKLRLQVRDLKLEETIIRDGTAAISAQIKVTPDNAATYTIQYVKIKSAEGKSYIIHQAKSPEELNACIDLLSDALEKEHGMRLYPIYFEESNFSRCEMDLEGMKVQIFFGYDVYNVSVSTSDCMRIANVFDDFALYLSLRLHEMAAQ